MSIRSHDRDLEKFTAGPNKPPNTIMRVSLRHTGCLSFNNNTYRLLGRPAAVYLYFSRVRDLIAVEPVQSINLPGAFPVLQKTHSGWRINAAAFCRHYGIAIDGTVRFVSPEINSGKLELKLAQTISVAQLRPRGKRK